MTGPPATPRRPRLAFVSPVFLFPNDAGGKIRSTNILRGLKGGAFDVTLAGPATAQQQRQWSAEIASVCDEWIGWRATAAAPRWRRAFDLFGELPVNVAADRTSAGRRAVAALAQRGDIDLIVFDFVHSAVLLPAAALRQASVCFTHNVEAEIFARHAQQARGAAGRWLWSSQHAKMARFEGAALRRFSAVIAVSERDAAYFRRDDALSCVRAIPTGVDLQFFGWQLPPIPNTPAADAPPTVVFTGSMDWAANIDGVTFFIERVWPLVLAGCPSARFVVVGRQPPAALIALAARSRQVAFTGFVDDVRPHVHAAQAFVIPLFVGGGTRIKAFEAMAMGCPVVSTSIGIEGLQAEAGRHYLARDDAESIAAAVLALLGDRALRERLSRDARALVEQRFGHTVAAEAFESACLAALASHASRRRAAARPRKAVETSGV